MREYKNNERHKAWHKEHDNAVGVNDKLILNLRDLSHTMRFLYEGKGSQKRILIVLEEIGGSITQQELTERLGIRPGSASEVIAKLESMGYISRTPNETDRRTADIVLTESGKIAAAEASAQRRQRHVEMFSCLSDDEKKELLMLLEKVNKDWTLRYQGSEDSLRGQGHPHGKHRYYGEASRKEMHHSKGE